MATASSASLRPAIPKRRRRRKANTNTDEFVVMGTTGHGDDEGKHRTSETVLVYYNTIDSVLGEKDHRLSECACFTESTK